MNSIVKTLVTPTGVKLNHFADGLVLAQNTKYSFTDFDKPIQDALR